MSWAFLPILQLAFTAAAMLACLGLFWTVKRENAELRRRLAQQQGELDERVESFRHSLDRMMESIEVNNEVKPALVTTPVVTAGASMNLNKRSQALRMFRRGEPADRIAAALRMSRNEVELILKVHRTVVENT